MSSAETAATLVASPPLPRPAPVRRLGAFARLDLPLLVVAVTAVGLRLLVLACSGGLHSAAEYDDGVHYGVAALLLHGVVPYRDQTFLQPPGVVALMLPFAALGRVFGDAVGLDAARVATCAVGGLVTYRVGSWVRAEAGPAAGLLAAMLCATAAPGLTGGWTAMLEPWLDLAAVVGLALTASAVRGGDRRRALWAGVALAAGVLIKAWGVLPLVVAAAWLGWRHRRLLRSLVTGAALTVAAVCLPFLALAGWRMVRDVVTVQLGRPVDGLQGTLARSVDLTGARTLLPGLFPQQRVVVVLTVIAFAAALLVAWRRPIGRVAAAWLVGAVVMFLLAAPFFSHYADFLVPPACALLAVGAVDGATTARRCWLRGDGRQAGGWLLATTCALGGLAGLAAIGPASALARTGEPPAPVAAMRAASAHGCVAADNVTLLELANAVHRPHCPSWLDPRGQAITDVDGSPAGFYPNGLRDQREWQQQWATYLSAAQTLLLSGNPDAHPEWSPRLTSYVATHFHPVARRPDRSPVQIWVR